MKQTHQEEVTEFFGEVVAEVSQTLSECEIDEEVIWKLSRQLHGVWREAMKRLHDEETDQKRRPGESHPAFSELMRLIHSEMTPGIHRE